MRHGSLFSGIGGFDVASEWMGWDNIFHCEWNEFGQQILKYYWPQAISYGDITKTDFTVHRGTIDILTGGFPCQPYSTAGKRLGKEDDRHLWPEMLRAIREIQPTWIVGENVRGLTNWNGGMVFHEVQADLEAEGYEVTPFLLPACAVNAPHRRDRIWFIAYSSSYGHKSGGFGENRSKEETGKRKGYQRERVWSDVGGVGEPSTITDTSSIRCRRGSEQPKPNKPKEQPMDKNQQQYGYGVRGEIEGCSANVADTDSKGLQEWVQRGRGIIQDQAGTFQGCKSARAYTKGYWDEFPTQSPVCSGNDGISSIPHSITISENRDNMDRNLVTKKCLDEGRLKVNFETGKIYSLKQRGREGEEIELLGSDCNGYIVHGIRYNGYKIQLRSHQIVWIAANGIYDKSVFMIDHINRDKKDNRLSNLRLVDAQGNRDNATVYNGKLSEYQKDMMAWLNKEDGIPMRELAEDFGISKSRVQQIISEHNGIYGITFPKWRNESIKGAGNAIVPQVAFEIFKAIEAYESL